MVSSRKVSNDSQNGGHPVGVKKPQFRHRRARGDTGVDIARRIPCRDRPTDRPNNYPAINELSTVLNWHAGEVQSVDQLRRLQIESEYLWEPPQERLIGVCRSHIGGMVSCKVWPF